MQAFRPGIGMEKVHLVNLSLNLPGPRGSQMKITVYLKRKKEIHSLLVHNLVLVVSLRTVSWFG